MARVVAVVPDLMFASRIEATLGAAGHDVELVSAPADAAGSSPDVVVADLADADAGELSAAGVPVLGFYSHVDVETRRHAEAEGVDLVVPRSRMAREMPELVDSLLDE